MRRRLLIGSLLGLFTQWSGNTLISYYLDTILTQVGFTDPLVKGKLNVGLTCWNLINATGLALVVTRFKRRKMYLICTVSLLVSYRLASFSLPIWKMEKEIPKFPKIRYAHP
jgi:hypothetical protein